MDNAALHAYASYPERLYAVLDGVVVYEVGLVSESLFSNVFLYLNFYNFGLI